MTERAKQTAADTVFVWEIGMLRFLFCKGFLNEAEYRGRKGAESKLKKNG